MHKLFSYGTLRQPDVQRALFGCLIEGRPDALPGYRLDPVTIENEAAVALSGAEVHWIAKASGDVGDQVPGLVLTLTDAQLAAADAYESDAYTRIEVTLASGRRAWLYARA